MSYDYDEAYRRRQEWEMQYLNHLQSQSIQSGFRNNEFPINAGNTVGPGLLGLLIGLLFGRRY